MGSNRHISPFSKSALTPAPVRRTHATLLAVESARPSRDSSYGSTTVDAFSDVSAAMWCGRYDEYEVKSAGNPYQVKTGR